MIRRAAIRVKIKYEIRCRDILSKFYLIQLQVQDKIQLSGTAKDCTGWHGMAWHHCDSPLPRNDLLKMRHRIYFPADGCASAVMEPNMGVMASCCLYTYTTYCAWQMTFIVTRGKKLTCFPCLSIYSPTILLLRCGERFGGSVCTSLSVL